MAEKLTSPLEIAAQYAQSYTQSLDSRPVAAIRSVSELREALPATLPEKKEQAGRVIENLISTTEGGHISSTSGRFFAWVIGGTLPSALAADWLVSMWDNNAALASCGPAAAVIEEIAGSWVKELLRLPSEASFAFTTGCQMAHVTCLAAARHALLRQNGHDVEREGLYHADPIRVITTEHHHGSVERALRFLGMGTACIEALETDSTHRLSGDSVIRALQRHHSPAILILDAGDLNVGAMDHFDDIIPRAKASGAWVHIDGAFGLWARTSNRYTELTKGLELADSWATDAHKWLNTPMDCGIAIIRDTYSHRAAMTIDASYLSAAKDTRDQIDWTPEWSRRARGIPVYAAIQELGREGITEMVERCCDMAALLVDRLAELPGVKLVARPTINQGLVCFTAPSQNASEVEHDAYTDLIINAINAEGTAFFSGTSWKGHRAMRISVVNWRTDVDAINDTVKAVARVLERYNS
ncbi:TPA: aspartate aminotransferase family protein [Citrobacter freundii]